MINAMNYHAIKGRESTSSEQPQHKDFALPALETMACANTEYMADLLNKPKAWDTKGNGL